MNADEARMEDAVEGIGGRIRQMRRKLKLTQPQLAHLVGIGQDSVSKHELGRMGVSSDALVSYAKVFGVSVDWLAGESNAAEPGPAAAPLNAPGPQRRDATVPMGVVRLLNDGRCNPISDTEIAYLARHLAEGGAAELDDLEIVLLGYRAATDRKLETVRQLRDAIERDGKRKARRIAEPQAQAAAAKSAKKTEVTS